MAAVVTENVQSMICAYAIEIGREMIVEIVSFVLFAEKDINPSV